MRKNYLRVSKKWTSTTVWTQPNDLLERIAQLLETCTTARLLFTQKLPQALGFSDYAHFAKTFKRLTEMIPKQFNQNYQV